MNCCDQTIIPFTDSGGMTIPYTVGLKEKYGNIPHVLVYHLDAGQYIRANIQIAIDGNPVTEISFDNGGAASGFAKIFK